MKRFFILLLFLLITNCQAIAAPFNKMVFFGDSLTDNGNLYQSFLKLIPKSPPYYKGRFSNGITWAENISKLYYDQSYIESANYAVGGATAVLHMPTGRFAAPTNLGLEVDKYLIDTTFRDRSKTLYSVWIGGNDYIFNPNLALEETTSRITREIARNITRLINGGGRYFLIFNLPDLSKIPDSRGGMQEKLHEFTLMHNEKLAKEVKNIIDIYPGINIVYFNVYDIFNDLMNNPQKYNEKYNVNITNIHDACWQGSYKLKQILSTSGLEKDLQQEIIEQTSTNHNDIDLTAMSKFILNSPDIAEAYSLGKLHGQGMVPCPNPNDFLFWDTIHPTAIVHEILARIVFTLLQAQMP